MTVQELIDKLRLRNRDYEVTAFNIDDDRVVTSFHVRDVTSFQVRDALPQDCTVDLILRRKSNMMTVRELITALLLCDLDNHIVIGTDDDRPYVLTSVEPIQDPNYPNQVGIMLERVGG